MKRLIIITVVMLSAVSVFAFNFSGSGGGGGKRYNVNVSKLEIKGAAWSAAENYSSTTTRQHGVTHSGSTWIALQNSINQEPTAASAYWAAYIAQGPTGPQGIQGEPGAGFEADIDGRRGVTLLANTVPFTGYSAGKNYIYYNTNGDLVQRKNGGSEEAIGTGTGGGSTFETKERAVLTNMSTGKMYFPQSFAKHTLPLAGANKWVDIFAQTSSAHISANSETGVIRQFGGITSDAGYTVRIPKGSYYKAVSKETGFWEFLKIIGENITQHIADFVASLSFTPSSKSFADTATGASSALQTFTVSNSGNATGNLGTFSLYSTNADQFTLSDNTCGSTLAPAASCTMNVAFTPTTAGAKSANIGDGTLLAALTGTGTSGSVLKQNLGPNITTGEFWVYNTNDQRLSGSFVADSSYTLTSVEIALKKNLGNPLTNPVPVYLYADSSFTVGTLLATSTSNISGTLTTSNVYYPASFEGYPLVSGTRYWIAVGGTIDNANVPQWAYDGAGTEKSAKYNGTIWGSLTTKQMTMKLYGY